MYDHYPVFIYDSSSSLAKSKAKNEIIKRNLHNFHEGLFLQELTERLNSFQIRNDMSLHDQYNNFIHIFKEVINKHAPIKKLSRKESKLYNKPWITKGILKSIKYKNILYRKLKKSLRNHWPKLINITEIWSID